MSQEDYSAWAARLRESYGIATPIDETMPDEDDTDGQ